MLRLLVAAGLLVAPGLVQAQEGAPPQRIRSVEIRKGEACPTSQTPGEVVVCRTVEEPYRIPSEFRDEGAAQNPANQSWVNRAATVDQVSRVSGGLPDTCSPVGMGGQTGCAQAAARAYAADRRARARSDGSGSQPR
jgi:hypothetical protein